MDHKQINIKNLPPKFNHSKLRQGMALGIEPFTYLARNQKVFGDAFTITPLGTPPMVFITEPSSVKKVLTLPDDFIEQTKVPFPIDIGEKTQVF